MWSRLLRVLATQFRGYPLLINSDAFMPLCDAARELLEANHGTLMWGLARHSTSSGSDPLSWTASLMANHDVPIFGCRPPSTVREQLPYDLLLATGFEDEARTISREGFGTYTDLVVKRDEFRAMIPVLSGTG